VTSRTVGRPRHVTQLLVVVFLLAAALPLSLVQAGQPAQAAPARTEITLADISPVSVRPEKTLRITGRVSSERNLRDVIVQLELGQTPFVSRSAVTEAAASQPLTFPVTGAVDELPRVQAGASRAFRIAIPGNELPLFDAGVYPLRLVVTAGRVSTVLAQTNTFIPWAPEEVGISPSRLLFFWPLIDTPWRDAENAPTAPALRQKIGANGRLSTLSEVGADADVTWIVDPLLLSDVYQLGNSKSEAWLASLRANIGDADAAAVPFGDPDLAAAAAADRPSIVRKADTRGSQVVSALLDDTFRYDLGWPADGAADQQTIDIARRTGDDLLLLDESSAPLVTPETYTPSGRVQQVDPEMELLLSDRPASALVASPAKTQNDIVLSRQRFLAETYLHARELPDTPRLLVLTPPRRWDPDPKWAQALMDGIDQASWLAPVTLDEAVTPSPPVFAREEPVIPETAALRELPTELVVNAANELPNVQRFRAILTRPALLARPIEDALFSSLSTAWRADHEGAIASQGATIEQLTTLRSKVRIISGGGTLSDDSGPLPVSIRNQLDQAVRVRLSVEPVDPLRLRARVPDETTRIDAQDSVSISVRLDAVVSGQAPVEAQILTPNGNPYSDPVILDVDVRGYGRVALLVFGAAAALMVIAAGVRITRRIRSRGSP